MDGPTLDQSDSESGDSWTLLEPNILHGEDEPDFAELPAERLSNQEKDEDTDGISIISDSEPDLPLPCKINEDYMPEECPTEHEISQCILSNSLSNINEHHKTVSADDDFLGINNIKHKTYVHRRNKRLSNVLNIIVLGSVITAAGVAIGHMWGAKNDCSIHTTPTVNKILSNLYKLQEENAYLRSKLKEITTLNNHQISLQKPSAKQNRCKKMFEESLNSDNIDKVTKCLDDKFNNNDKLLSSHLVNPHYEKEFVSDIDKLKNVYFENKSWLDNEISQRLKQEERSVNTLKNKHILKLQKINEEKDLKNENILNEQEVQTHFTNDFAFQDEHTDEVNNSKRISYADSLKSTEKIKNIVNGKENNKPYKVEHRDKKLKGDNSLKLDDSTSEYEFIKDNRYKGQKFKPEKKKHDRQKLHKKQKRKNKYEQWEMKGGFLKDYDDISFKSSQDVEGASKNDILNSNNHYEITLIKDNTKFEKNADIDNQFMGAKTSNDKLQTKYEKVLKRGNNNEAEASWLDKRAILRTEARKKLEQELFGESPNTAGWYFRRMHKREQCRAKTDNSTYRKLLKRNMNFKMKH